MVNKEIVAQTINHYGKAKQSVVCMEECSELIQAISKELRGLHNLDHLTEEMADVTICLELLKQIYGIEDNEIQKWVDSKQIRSVKRMKGDEGMSEILPSQEELLDRAFRRGYEQAIEKFAEKLHEMAVKNLVTVPYKMAVVDEIDIDNIEMALLKQDKGAEE